MPLTFFRCHSSSKRRLWSSRLGCTKHRLFARNRTGLRAGIGALGYSGPDYGLDRIRDAEQEIARLKDPLEHTDKNLKPDDEIPSLEMRSACSSCSSSSAQPIRASIPARSARCPSPLPASRNAMTK